MQLVYGYWGECPDHPVTSWQAEVSNNETRLGYWDWVEAQLAGGEEAEQPIEESS